jgi:hypothetical protein
LKQPINFHKTVAKQSLPIRDPSAEPHYSQAQQDYSQHQSIVHTPFVPSHYFTNPLQNYFVFDINDHVTQVRTADEISTHASTPVFEKMVKQENIRPRLYYPSPVNSSFLAPLQGATMRTDRQFMSQEERISFYDFIDSVLGPASGVQESVGTYKAYMAEQSRLYFERILPGSHDHMRKVQAQTYVRSQTISQPQVQPSADSVDFRKWLVSDGSANSSLDDQRSSAPHYFLDGTLVPEVCSEKNRSSTSSLLERVPYGAEDIIAYTLDDLFPDAKENSLNEDNALVSPVVRSNNSRHSPITWGSWKDYLVDEDDTAISPTLIMDSPSTQQASPNLESSPFFGTPTSEEQFIQHNKPHFGSTYSPHVPPTLQDGADTNHSALLSLDLCFQDEAVGLKGRTFEDVFTIQNTRALSFRDTVVPLERKPSEITRTKLSGAAVGRMRTSSAGGGI